MYPHPVTGSSARARARARPPRLRPARYARYSLLPKCRDYARDRNRDSPSPALRIAEYRLSRGYCRRCLGGIPNRIGDLFRGACSFTQAAVRTEESRRENYRAEERSPSDEKFPRSVILQSKIPNCTLRRNT